MNYFKQLFQYNKSERIGLYLLLLLLAFVIGEKYATWKQPTKEEHKKEEVQQVPKQFKPKKEIPKIRKEKKQKKVTKKRDVTPKAKTKSPKREYFKTKKLAQGRIVELNKADTLLLKKVPGIGTVLANRIVKYRHLLGGYISTNQLKEVYGIDKERWEQIKPWFKVDPSLAKKIDLNKADFRTLSYHPYISKEQAKMILRIKKRKGIIKDWNELKICSLMDSTAYARFKTYLIIKTNHTHK